MDLSDSSRILVPGRDPVLAYSPHPLDPARDRELIYALFTPGETIAQYLERSGIARKIGRRPVLCTIDGHRVPRELWPHVRPKHGTLVNLTVLVRGGGGGKKNPIATVLQIGLMFVAPALGALAAGALGIAGTTILGISAATILGGVISFAGGLVINSLFPPPKPNISQAQGRLAGPAESPTYALTGGSNRMRPFEPLMKICGKHRVFPDLGGRPFTEFQGEDQYLYMVFDFGYNDVILSEFKIGATSISKYQGVTLQESGEDGKITLVHGNVDSQQGAALTAAAGWIQRTSSPNATALAIEIVGQQYGISTTDGSIVEISRNIEAEYRLVGSAPWLPFWAGSSQITISNGRRAPVRKMYKITVTEGQYEIRVRRTSADETLDTEVSDLSWSQLRTYQPDTADYTGRKRVGLKIKASGQINGVVDQFSAMASGRCETWNGSSWVVAETSNPAWWVLDAARGKRVGSRRVWGGMIPDERIGLENLKLFGAWCTAKSLTFDAVFDQQISVFEMLNAIALCGRGTVSRGSGRLEVVWDAPDQPVVGVFSMSNIKRDTFEIVYQTGDLADEIVLSFINVDLDWQRDTVRQLVGGATEPVRSRSVELFGCVRKAMAGKAVNLYAAQQVLRAKTYKWQTDWEGMPAQRGNVAKLAHDLASADYSGRLIEGSSSTVLKLSRKVPLAAAGSFVTIVRPDQHFATYDVVAGFGDTDELTLTEALDFDPGADPEHPVYDYKWLFGHASTPGKKVKIAGWKPVSHDTVEITAVDELPEFYASEDAPYQYTAPTQVFGSVEISNLELTEDGVRAGTGYLVKCTASWDTGGDYASAEVRVSINGGPLEPRGETRGRSFTFTAPDLAAVVVEVTAWSSLKRLGQFEVVTASRTLNFAAAARPDPVLIFTVDGDLLKWVFANAVDVIGYRIRFHYGDRRTWEDAAPLHDGLLTASPWRPESRPSGPLTFMIKPVDAAYLESTDAAVIVTDLGDAAIANVLEEFDLQAEGFPGTIEGGAVAGGDLVADETDGLYRPSDSAPFYATSDGDTFYHGTDYTEMVYTTGEIVPSEPLSGSTLTIVSAIEGSPVYIEYRQSGPAPMFSDDDSDAFYSDDDEAPFYSPAPGWSVWPGSIVVTHQPYEFRFITGQGQVQGAITELKLVVDAPDIVEELDDIEIDAAGTRLPITKTFNVIKNVQLTLQADGGDAVGVLILDKDTEFGPLTRCIDGASSFVDGLVDARIKGY